MISLGDRIKSYEKVNRYSLTKRTPVMIRVDGRAFHTSTSQFNKPFDNNFIHTMIASANYVAEEMQGFKVAYIQSDEVTFCITDYDTIDTQGWFDYDLSKIVSITASLMSAAFNRFSHQYANCMYPVFDCRAFNVPKEDAVNAFLWRAKDWTRNSIQMYARSLFSHKQLHKKSIKEIHEMLHKIGKNWATNLTDKQKNGTFLILNNGAIEDRADILPNYQNINDAIGKFFICQ